MSKVTFDRRRLAAPDVTVQPVLHPSLRPERPLLDAELTREDGRYPEQMRPVFIKKGIISRANGSAYIELGNTKLTCAVYGPRSASGRTVTHKAYSPLGSDAEEAELSAVLESSIEPSVRRDLFPNAHVDIFVTILEDDGSVLSASIIAASTALAQAQVECYDSVTACSAMINESIIIVDPTREEQDSLAKRPTTRSLVTCAIMPNLNRVTQIHSVGPLSASLYQEALNTSLDGAKAVYESTILPTIKSE